MQNIVVLIILGLTLVGCCYVAGCSKPAQNTAATSNTEFADEVLFTDSTGHTVHRFHDGGYYHYYVTPGPATATDVQQHGKNDVRHEQIVTSPER